MKTRNTATCCWIPILNSAASTFFDFKQRVVSQNRKLDSLNTRNQKAKQGGYPKNHHQLLPGVPPYRAKGKRLFQSHLKPSKFSLMKSVPLPPGKSSNSFSAVSEESANSLEPMESETDITSALGLQVSSFS